MNKLKQWRCWWQHDHDFKMVGSITRFWVAGKVEMETYQFRCGNCNSLLHKHVKEIN